MKKISRTKAIAISLVMAFIATLLIIKAVSTIGGPRVEMVIVAEYIKAGTPIQKNALRTENMPAKYAVDAVQNIEDVIGKRSSIDLVPGLPLLQNVISDKPMKNGLYPGEVSIRVPVDAVSSGGALPGDYVDILVPIGNTHVGQQTQMTTLLKNKRVVALYNASGQRIEHTPVANTTAGLTMTPAAVYVPTVAEIALQSTHEREQLASAGKVVLSLAPWGNLEEFDYTGYSQDYYEEEYHGQDYYYGEADEFYDQDYYEEVEVPYDQEYYYENMEEENQ